MRKRILSMVCAICVLFLAGGECVNAAVMEAPVVDELTAEGSEEGIMPLWDNISLYITSIAIEGSTLSPYAYVGAKGRSSISITMTLQRKRTGSSTWTDVDPSWTTSGTATELQLTKTATASRGYTYRTKAVYTVNGETITTYSSNTVSY